MTEDIHNPVSIEEKIRETVTRIAKSASECNRRYVAKNETEEAFIKAYARAFLGHEGPQTEKRYAADLATEDERHAANVAEAAYRYADRLAKTLEAELMAYQSIAKSVGRMFNAAGVGQP